MASLGIVIGVALVGRVNLVFIELYSIDLGTFGFNLIDRESQTMFTELAVVLQIFEQWGISVKIPGGI